MIPGRLPGRGELLKEMTCIFWYILTFRYRKKKRHESQGKSRSKIKGARRTQMTWLELQDEEADSREGSPSEGPSDPGRGGEGRGCPTPGSRQTPNACATQVRAAEHSIPVTQSP